MDVAEPALAFDPVIELGSALPDVPVEATDRIRILDEIWGESFSKPGGATAVTDLLAPAGLSPATSVLDLGAGLGGSSRAMAESFGAWVTGMESDPVLAEAGHARSVARGLDKRAPIRLHDPETVELHQRYDCVFAKEAFFVVQDKDRLFDEITRALKPRGHLVFTDLLVDARMASDGPLEGWKSAEPVRPNLWSVDQMLQAMRGRGYDVRTSTDVTAEYRRHILQAWSRLAPTLARFQNERPLLVAALREAELWARRLRAIETGLRAYRFAALRTL